MARPRKYRRVCCIPEKKWFGGVLHAYDKALSLALDHPDSGVVNVASGEPVAVRDLLAASADALGSSQRFRRRSVWGEQIF